MDVNKNLKIKILESNDFIGVSYDVLVLDSNMRHDTDMIVEGIKTEHKQISK